MVRSLGQLEAAALAYVQMRSIRTVRTGDLIDPLRVNAKQERELLSRMARTGIIANAQRGLYLFPAKLPIGGIWTPDEATAITVLMAEKQARYQITGLSAFNRYGYDDQIPSRITLYNDALSGDRTIGQVNLTLIKVGADRLGSSEHVEMPEGETLIYSSRVRTLVDGVYDWSRFDSLPRAYQWIARELDAGRVAVSELAETAARYGNIGTIRRIGALLEQMDVKEPVLRRLERALTPSTAKIPFIPDRPTRGTLLQRWGVVLNV